MADLFNVFNINTVLSYSSGNLSLATSTCAGLDHSAARACVSGAAQLLTTQPWLKPDARIVYRAGLACPAGFFNGQGARQVLLRVAFAGSSSTARRNT